MGVGQFLEHSWGLSLVLVVIKDASKSKQKLEEKEVLAEKIEKDFDEEL